MAPESDTDGSIEMPTGLRATALDALAYFGGRAPSVDIGEVANIPSGSRTYHLKKLVETGLIEADGTSRTDSGQEAKVYRLTAEGERAIERMGAGDVVSDDVDKLRGEVVRLRKRVADLEDRLEDHDEKFRKLHERLAD